MLEISEKKNYSEYKGLKKKLTFQNMMLIHYKICRNLLVESLKFW